MMLIATLAVGSLMMSATQEVYANHQAENRNGPNPSETGIENGAILHPGTGLGDHGCVRQNPGPDGPGANGYQQGSSNSGSECKLESIVE